MPIVASTGLLAIKASNALTFIPRPFARMYTTILMFQVYLYICFSDFPNCPKDASECLFIHPEVSSSQQQQRAPSVMTPPAKKPFPCRFFPYCTNPVCPYIHPDPSSMPAVTQQQQQQQSTPTKVPIPCKNGENCKRPGCHFLHPGEENPLADVLVSDKRLGFLILCH